MIIILNDNDDDDNNNNNNNNNNNDNNNSVLTFTMRAKYRYINKSLIILHATQKYLLERTTTDVHWNDDEDDDDYDSDTTTMAIVMVMVTATMMMIFRSEQIYLEAKEGVGILGYNF